MTEKIIYIEEVGNVLFKHSSRAKRLNISVKPFVGARVSIPNGISFSLAIQLVTDKKLWLKQHLDKMRSYEKQKTLFDENSEYFTKNHKLQLKKTYRNNISVKLSKGKINVSYPIKLDPSSEDVQLAIRKGIERALRIEAWEYLPDKVKQLAERFNFRYNKLALKNIKSRWGSCSSKNNINLSIHLMRLPEHLIEYVILHELAHTVHHNHSVKFWKLLDDVTNGARILDKELSKYNITIY